MIDSIVICFVEVGFMRGLLPRLISSQESLKRLPVPRL